MSEQKNRNGIFWVVIAAFVLFFAPHYAIADEALRLYNQGYFAKAVAIWKKDAKTGLPKAQFNLSRAFLTGKGTDKDLDQALYWLEKAAKGNYPPALHNQALQYLEDQKISSALQKLEKAANQNFPASLYSLGKMHQAGLTGSENPKKAFALIRSAGELGFHKAQYNLGKMYRDGYGVKADMKQSTQWFLRAAHQGHLKAQIKMIMRYQKGVGISADPAQAYKWLLIAEERYRGFSLTKKKKLLDSLSLEERNLAAAEAQLFRPVLEK
ncbi:MAG: sel1 repeat family protein [Sneathiellales bacterium]|nr:sel1 repeat family protein [Sneathiellales bacterium]